MAEILIIDDEPGIRKTLRRQLVKMGHEIREAEDGRKGVEVIESNPPDLILLDILMPVLGGYETCKLIKSNPVCKDVPIIFMTAKSEPEDIVEGFSCGAVDYVTKPFNLEELFVRIQNHLELKKAKEALQESVFEQRRLLHTLCHDLMNPLGHVDATLRLIQVKPERMDLLMKSLLNSVNNGINIINLVREMRSAVEKSLDLKKVDLGEAVAEALEIISYQARNKNITIENNLPGSISVLAERTSLVNSVINNLLSNAIKFSYNDSKISINCEREEGVVNLKIKDSGIGMSEHLIGKIFNVTEKTSRLGTKGESGTGFGLPLVKKYVELYGGFISVVSFDESDHPDDHGTEIKICLRSV